MRTLFKHILEYLWKNRTTRDKRSRSLFLLSTNQLSTRGDPMQTLIPHEEISVLALRLYRKNIQYDEMIFRLAKLCKTLQLNLDLNGCQDDAWIDINVFKTVDDMRARLRHDKLIEPNSEDVEELAKIIKEQKPEKSKLHWFIAEKTLVLEKLKKMFEEQ